MTFSEKIKEELKKEYPYKVELHAHTSPASRCSHIPPEGMVKWLSASGYDCIVVTNHLYLKSDKFNTVKEYFDFWKHDYLETKKAGEEYGVKILLGAELRFMNENDNDYLLWGIELDDVDEIYTYLDSTLENFVKNGKKDYMFITQAHPFRDDMIRMNPELLDGVEAFNMHTHHNSRVILAANYARDNKKIATIGSDYHEFEADNVSLTRFKKLPESSADLVELIRNNDFIFETAGYIMI